MNQNSIPLSAYLDVIYRHWLAMVCSLLVGTGLLISALIMIPNVYQSSTLVMIEPPAVSTHYVSAPLTTSIAERLHALSKEALSRTRLEQIINEFKLYPYRVKHKPIEDVVRYMQRHIQVELSKETESRKTSGGSFRITFAYFDPRLAQKVTARLADIFIDEDLKQRTLQAAATTQFLDDQLAKVRRQLEEKSQEIKLFKDRYQGSLPQDLEANVRILGELQSELGRVNEALSSVEDRFTQLSREEAKAREEAITITSASGEKSLASPQAALASMETQLTVLRAQYSDEHPDVVQLRAQIKALKERLSKPEASSSQEFSPFTQELEKEREALSLRRKSLEREKKNLELQIDRVQERVKATPGHAQQLASLERDYEVLAAHYNELLNNRLSAQMSQTLEQRAQGERFRVIDPADLPKTPMQPDRFAIASLGLLVTIALSLFLPFGLEMLDSSVKEPDQLRQEFGLPVAAVIPSLDEEQQSTERLWTLIKAGAVSCMCLVLGVTGLWYYATTIF